MYVTSIGLDVHARSISAAAFNPFTGEITQAEFPAQAEPIAKWAKQFESPKCVYESGPTGWHLARELKALGVDCSVAAVSKMQKPSADKRRKNDKRDAAFLARMLACHNIVEVFIPTEEIEAVRDLSRALDDARIDLQRARQRLSKFLLRRGYVFDEKNALNQRKSAWTRDHRKWLESVTFTGPARVTFVHYVTCVRCAETDKRSLEKAVKTEARTDRWAPSVRALSTIKGIDEVSAFCLAAEAGLFSRFGSAEEYASWCGLIPSEHSSGEKESTGHITKTGNNASRRILVESAWHFASCSAKPKQIPDEWCVPTSIRLTGQCLHQTSYSKACPTLESHAQPLYRQCRGRPRACLLGLGDRTASGRNLSRKIGAYLS